MWAHHTFCACISVLSVHSVRSVLGFVRGVRLWGPGLWLNVWLSSPTPATHLLLNSSSLSLCHNCYQHYTVLSVMIITGTFIIIVIPSMVIKNNEIGIWSYAKWQLLIPGTCSAYKFEKSRNTARSRTSGAPRHWGLRFEGLERLLKVGVFGALS